MFEKLFSSSSINGVRLKNRIVMAPMVTNLNSLDGFITERSKEYYARRAKGGVGLIQVGSAVVVYPEGGGGRNNIAIDEDKFIPGLTDFVESVKKASPNVKISVQLAHVGPHARQGIRDAVSFGASAIPSGDFVTRIPLELSVEEIEKIVRAFAGAAGRAKQAGFDMIGLHFAHGYLISNFISPKTNRRKDEYGGSLENRFRFGKEILQQCRESVGKAFPIIVRINTDDCTEGGQTIEGAKIIARLCEENGANAIDVSCGGSLGTFPLGDPTSAAPRGVLLRHAMAIREVLTIPVIVGRRIMTPEYAEQILQETNIELINMGRPLIADPDLPKKAAEGRVEDIVPCIACCQGCYDYLRSQKPITCLANPMVGREKELRELTKTTRPKKVFVVGGGPAGLEAAIVASARGHQVTIYEKSATLGGQLNLASTPSFRQEMNRLVDYFLTQIKKFGIVVHLGKEVDLREIEELKPDIVIVATGAKPLVPPIPGLEKSNVSTAWDLLSGKAKFVGKIVVIGGGKVGCHVAEFLAEKKQDVTIVEMLGEIASDMGPENRKWTLLRLNGKGVKVLTNTKLIEILEKEVVLERDGKGKLLPVDTVILALGAVPERGLVEKLVGRGISLYMLGDCATVGDALDAIREGYRIGNSI
jgi:2,4-dienoyl-CoA reductase-like NADH-dependent reductase (Old Yellow Enzyme family)/thioredoxin reductase